MSLKKNDQSDNNRFLPVLYKRHIILYVNLDYIINFIFYYFLKMVGVPYPLAIN